MYSLLLVVVVLELAALPVHRVPAVRLGGVLRGPLRGGGRGLAAAVPPVPGVGRAGVRSHITPAVQNKKSFQRFCGYDLLSFTIAIYLK